MNQSSKRVPLVYRLVVIAAAVTLTAVGYWMTRTAPVEVKAAPVLGGPLPNLTSLENTMYTQGQFPFNKAWDFVQGLGPVFTQIGCQFCHSSPVLGGNSTQRSTFFGSVNLDGTFNPLFNEGGPLLQKMTIQMFRSNCKVKGETIPSDATIVALHQPPPLFGLGLVDNIPDNAILSNAVDKGQGIHGVANMVLDENNHVRVGRFGLKGEFATLVQAAAEAQGHDLTVTNPIVPDEDLPQGKPIPPNCSITTEPNDPSKQMMGMYHFLLYMAPNTPGAPNANGKALFKSTGCTLCHTPSYTTAKTVIVPVEWKGRTIQSNALANKPVQLYSDLLLHDMGPGLADGLPMGLATGSMFRTAPLWGLSVKISTGNGLLHDGRVTDAASAIQAHGGEASQVLANFNALSPQDQADLIAFISSL